MAQSRTDRTVVWGIASGLLFLAAATLLPRRSPSTATSRGSVRVLLLAPLCSRGVAFFLTLAAHFEFWPYGPEQPKTLAGP